MNHFTKGIGTGLLSLALLAGNGCERSEPSLTNEYSVPAEAVSRDKKLKDIGSLTLEGKIVDVMPSSFPVLIRGEGGVANHCFEFVYFKSKVGEQKVFIYPLPKFIAKKDATIKFRPLETGSITMQNFVDAFLRKENALWPDYDKDYNFPIEADGVITSNGIDYKD